MANTIQIKRSTTAGNIPSLAAGELGVNLRDNTLYVGQDANTKLLIHSDTTDGSTTFKDASPSGHTVTKVGDPTHETEQKKFGASSIYFDGNDSLTVADNDDVNDFGTGDYTIDFWFNSSVTNQRYTSFFSTEGAGGGYTLLLNNANTSDGTIAYWGGLGSDVRTSSGGYNDGNWHHVALVRNGTSLAIYVDGVSKATATSSAAETDGSNTLIIGDSYYANRGLTGYMDEFRISKGIARWTAAFTPPTRRYGVMSPEPTGDHLPLSGGTLTGGLTANSTIQVSRSSASPLFQTTDADAGGGAKSRWFGLVDGTSRFAIYGTNGSTEEFKLDDGGAATFTGALTVGGALTGTTATFSGNVSLTADDGFVYLNNAGTGNSGVYIRGLSTDDMRCHVPTGKTYHWEVGAADIMSLTTGGALTLTGGITGTSATFSGAVGMGALTGTSATFSGSIIRSAANVDVAGIQLTSTTGTNGAGIRFRNTGGDYYLAVDNSAANRLMATGQSAAYALVAMSEGDYPFIVATNGTRRAIFTSTGLAVTGTGSFTGALTATSGTFSGAVGMGALTGTSATFSGDIQIGSKENWAFANAGGVLSIRETTSTATGGYGAFHVQAADDDSIFLMKVQSSGGYAELATQYNSSGEYKDISIFAGGNKDVYLQRTGTGKVGIGTAAPEGKLHIEKASSGATYTPDGSDILIVENNDSSLIDIRSPAANATGVLFSDTTRARGALYYYHSNDSMAFNTAGTTALTIDSSQKVGIGTTAPSNAGLNIGIASTDPTASYSANSQLLIGVPGGSTHKLAISRDTDGDNAYIHSYQDGVGAKNLILQPGGGNVGIGTTNPGTYKLYVNGSTKSGSVYPLSDNAHELGNTSLRWSSVTAVAVTGVSGTFSGALTATTVDTTGTVTIGNGAASTNGTLNLSGASGSWYGGRINIKRASATKGWVGSESLLGTNVDHLAVYGETGIEVAIYANASIKGRFTSTGLAVTGTGSFSGSVICESSLTVDSSLTGTTASFSGDGYFGGSLAVNTASVGSYKLYVTGNTKCAGFMIATNVQSQGAAFFDSNIRLKATATPTGTSSNGRLYAYNNVGAMLYYKDGYNTAHALHSASDYRLKENITDYSGSDACALVKGVNAKRFDYIADAAPADQRTNRVGFMANELQDAGCDFGGMVSGVKDETMDDGEGNQIPRMQSVDYKAMVPILWSALQNALERIEVLEEGNS